MLILVVYIRSVGAEWHWYIVREPLRGGAPGACVVALMLHEVGEEAIYLRPARITGGFEPQAVI